MRNHRNIFEVFYVMYSPLIMLLSNVICGLCYIFESYGIYYYLSMLSGYSLIFIPQFIINHKRYKLCKFYKAATITLFISMIINWLYYLNVFGNNIVYVRLSLIVNIVGCICYFFVKNCRKSKSTD